MSSVTSPPQTSAIHGMFASTPGSSAASGPGGAGRARR
ncbi:hypothetical protein MOTT12_02586 [Mycobacterium intracellulare subsp. yongonense]|nr:hypothetical protein MOTT12_02586 [Mycobacterium intracellulare subsp. yongonense]ETZ30429.1 hypothetical protein L842_2776 [Mycobacterium intracellulare MIN_052511_1280]